MIICYVIAFISFLMALCHDLRYGIITAVYAYFIVLLESLHKKYKNQTDHVRLIPEEGRDAVFSIDFHNQMCSGDPPSYSEAIAQRY